jgi:hypothetical protein
METKQPVSALPSVALSAEISDTKSFFVEGELNLAHLRAYLTDIYQNLQNVRTELKQVLDNLRTMRNELQQVTDNSNKLLRHLPIKTDDEPLIVTNETKTPLSSIPANNNSNSAALPKTGSCSHLSHLVRPETPEEDSEEDDADVKKEHAGSEHSIYKHSIYILDAASDAGSEQFHVNSAAVSSDEEEVVQESKKKDTAGDNKKKEIQYDVHDIGLNNKALLLGSVQSCMALFWPWNKAPEEFRIAMSQGGDEDNLAFIPTTYEDATYVDLTQNKEFGCCGVYSYICYDEDKSAVGGKVKLGTFKVGTHA